MQKRLVLAPALLFVLFRCADGSGLSGSTPKGSQGSKKTVESPAPASDPSPNAGSGTAAPEEQITNAGTAQSVSGAFLACGDADDQFGCAVTEGEGGPKIDDSTFTKVVAKMEGADDAEIEPIPAPSGSPWQIVFSLPYGATPAATSLIVSFTAEGKNEEVAPSAGLQTTKTAMPVVAGCKEAKASGMSTSGLVWAKDAASGKLTTHFCEQTLEDGGWTLSMNSVDAPKAAAGFWAVPYEKRTERSGKPSATAHYYDGGQFLLLQRGGTILDVIVDGAGKRVIASLVPVGGFDPKTMKFTGVGQSIKGLEAIRLAHVAGGWSAPERDIDEQKEINCAKFYQLTQHFTSCWVYAFEAEGKDLTVDGDGVRAPRIARDNAVELELAVSKEKYPIMARIARFVRPD